MNDTRQENVGRECRRCLTRELIGKEEFFANLQKILRQIDEDIKAEEDLYEQRLSVCKECELLLQGMCRSCGCYVELRAAVAKNVCPNHKW